MKTLKDGPSFGRSLKQLRKQKVRSDSLTSVNRPIRYRLNPEVIDRLRTKFKPAWKARKDIQPETLKRKANHGDTKTYLHAYRAELPVLLHTK